MAASLCPRCLLLRTLPIRTFSTGRALPSAAKSINPNLTDTSTPQRNLPSATSTAAAQPFTAPNTPAELPPDVVAAAKQPAAPRVVSSVPAGTPLYGINYLKNAEDPVALPDDEYPAWLWHVLEPKADAGPAKEETDPKLFARTSEQRRKARKRLKVRRAADPEALVPKVPVYEQTVDLPTGKGKEDDAAQARKLLNEAMRSKRRRDIKEKNFLQEMR